MRNVIRFFLAVSLLVSFNTAFAGVKTLKNCSQLKDPKAALLVHATWCSHCRAFKPIYHSVAKMASMKGHTLYIKQNNSLGPVCGRSVGAVPVLFTNNMQTRRVGKMGKHQLANYLKRY